METPTQPVLGYAIPADAGRRACLTAIWRLAGKPKGREPYRFKTRKRVRVWVSDSDYWRTSRGRDAGTWAWVGLALDYAEFVGLKAYIDPRAAPDPVRQEVPCDAQRQEAESPAGEPSAPLKEEVIKAQDLAAAARRFVEELKEKTLRNLEEVRARQAREQEEREQGFESYQEYDPDRPEDEDNGIDHGDDWMDLGAAAESDPTHDPATEFGHGLDDDFMDFILYGPEGRSIRASVN